MSRRNAPRQQRILVLSGSTTDLLTLRRLVLDSPFAVESARTLKQATELLQQHQFAAVIVDEGYGESAVAALAELRTRRPEMTRVLLAQPDSALEVPAGVEVVQRPYFAQPLRHILTQLALQLVDLDARDDTLRTGPPLSLTDLS